MDFNSTNDYLKLADALAAEYDIPGENVASLMGYMKSIYRSEVENKYSAPMLYIGMYIAAASLVCVVAMVADLLHGLCSRKLWFPCKYFRINAFYLAVIAVAMKLPVDLSASMPGDVDQVGKLGSMAFMCTTMANLLPHLATMDSNELLLNITALSILVITLVGNIIIQILTGVVSYKQDAQMLPVVSPNYAVKISKHRNTMLASIYIALLLVLLILHVCTCLAILKSKKIIDSKYQQGHGRASKDIQPSSGELLAVEKLQKHVSLLSYDICFWGNLVHDSNSNRTIYWSRDWAVFSSLAEETGSSERNKDLCLYVLRLEDEMELGDRTLEGLSISVNKLIQKGEKSKPKNLIELIDNKSTNKKSTNGFYGVEKFDQIVRYHVPSLLLKLQYQDCWSLAVVTLTTIAISLPKVEKNEVESLLQSVREGLVYVKLVEECLNVSDDYVSIRKEAETLWKEVDVDHEW
ncbi:hypothetical protein L1987_50054 [Smallanthus sonchifolius]|uniref:Uncharacterized protein n=1 Tax=Smallanthus sonchifolius TaxID=185202 RepID=A0ACB9FWE9_9ASTR|nr:hypothetical protein L1987_50054 [Smallanthus sonchifolius]